MRNWINPEEAMEAIKRGRGKGVRIAVLDSGVEISHPALDGLVLLDDVAIVEDGLRLKPVPGEGRDLYGHGTAVAGIIRRAAPEAEIGSFRVLGESLSARTAIILEGARMAIERGYHILNCSLGCAVPEHVLKYKSWVDEAYLRGVHVVAACNNHDFARPEWPGFFTSVLTVNMDGLVEVKQRFGSQCDLLNGRCRWHNGCNWCNRRGRRYRSDNGCDGLCWGHWSDRRYWSDCFFHQVWIAFCDGHCWSPETCAPAQIARCVVRAVATATYDVIIS